MVLGLWNPKSFVYTKNYLKTSVIDQETFFLLFFLLYDIGQFQFHYLNDAISKKHTVITALTDSYR